MTASFDRSHAVLGLERGCRTVEVGDGDQDVVELQACAEAAPPRLPRAMPGRASCRSCRGRSARLPRCRCGRPRRGPSPSPWRALRESGGLPSCLLRAKKKPAGAMRARRAAGHWLPGRVKRPASRELPSHPEHTAGRRGRAMPRRAARPVARRAGTLSALGVWRSLVARSVRVGEAPSSNLGTPIHRGGKPRFPPACPRSSPW